MGRFNHDDEDFQDENLFPDTESQEDFIKRQEAFDYMQLNIVKDELNQRLLHHVIKMCESQSDWKTKNHKSRLKIIAECYSVFRVLIDGPEDCPEEEVI